MSIQPYNCPHCHQPIFDEDALLCHFCGESLQRSSRGALGKIKYARPRVILLGAAVMVLLGFLAWMLGL